MNNTLEESIELANSIIKKINPAPDLPVIIVSPPFTSLATVGQLIKDTSTIFLSAQNCAFENAGAYTGEVSAKMVKSCGADYVILGHSERRKYFKETAEELSKKVNLALENSLMPIFCCGEELDVREQDQHFKLVKTQLKEGLFHLSTDDFKKVVIAYEPVWAIGTGVTASPDQAQEMHQYIRQLVAEQYSDEIANDFSILYGGSCKPGNARELFEQPDVDGGLIGGASLNADDFVEIIRCIKNEVAPISK